MLETATIALAVLCLTLTGGFGVLFALNPKRGMELATHRLEKLPLVMADRYVGTALLLLGVIWSGNMGLLAWFLGVVGVAGFIDAWIYARDGHRFGKHLFAGVLYVVGAACAMTVFLTSG